MLECLTRTTFLKWWQTNFSTWSGIGRHFSSPFRPKWAHMLLVIQGFLTKLKAVSHSAILLLTTIVGHTLFVHVSVHNLWTCYNITNTSSKYRLCLTSHHRDIITVLSNTTTCLHEVLLTTLMEQQTVTNTAVTNQCMVCVAWQTIKSAMHCLLRLVPRRWIILLVSTAT